MDVIRSGSDQEREELVLSACEAVTSDNMRNYFHHCGLAVEVLSQVAMVAAFSFCRRIRRRLFY